MKISRLLLVAAFMALAVPAFAQEISGNFAGGSIKIGDDTVACGAARYGAIRFNTNKFQGCSTGGWVDIGTFGGGGGGMTGLTGDVTASGTGSVVTTIAANAIGSAEVTDLSIAGTDIANTTIAVGKLSATGTANGTTYLRGDNTWATVPAGADNLGNHTATTTVNFANNQLSNVGQIMGSPWNATYDTWLQGGVAAAAAGGARNLALLGTDPDSGDTLYLNYFSEYSGGTVIGGPVTSTNGLTLSGGNVNLGSGGITSSAGTVIDGGGGWHRTYGDTGWFNGTHVGGWYMTDSTWIRSYGGKWIYTDTGIRADGNGVRTNQICDINGGNCKAQSSLGGGGLTACRTCIYVCAALSWDNSCSGYAWECSGYSSGNSWQGPSNPYGSYITSTAIQCY